MNARAVALKVIQDVTVRGAYANIALAKELAKQRELSGPDRRLVTELVYGTLKAQGTLDWALSHFLNRPLSKLTPVIRDILRMGVYQLLFLDRIPPSAACNEAVELAKRNGHIGVARFVNGVLGAALQDAQRPVSFAPLHAAILHLVGFKGRMRRHPLLADIRTHPGPRAHVGPDADGQLRIAHRDRSRVAGAHPRRRGDADLLAGSAPARPRRPEARARCG